MLFSGESYPRILSRKLKLGLDDRKSSRETIASSRGSVAMYGSGIIPLLFADLLDAATVPVVDSETLVVGPFFLKTRHSGLDHG